MCDCVCVFFCVITGESGVKKCLVSHSSQEIPEEPTKEKREEESQAAIDVTGLATGVNASGCLVADWPLRFVLDTPLVRRGQGRAYISPL